MDRYVEIVKVNYIEPKHEVILGSFLKKSSTAAQPTNKREIHRTLKIQRKSRSQITTRSLFYRAEERRNDEQTTGVNNKLDKQYHEVINID